MRAGGFGRFQCKKHKSQNIFNICAKINLCLMVFIVSIAFASGSHIMYATNYLMQQPAQMIQIKYVFSIYFLPLQRPYNFGIYSTLHPSRFLRPQYRKTHQGVLSKPITYFIGFVLDWSNPSSFENWVIQLNIYCDMDLSNKDNMILVSLIGQFFGQLFLSWLSDLYGRRPYFFFSLLAQIPIKLILFSIHKINKCLELHIFSIPFQVIAMYSRRLELTYFMYFFLGGCYVGRYFGAFVNISDQRYKHSYQKVIYEQAMFKYFYVDKRYRNALCTYLLALDCMVQMGVVLHFKYWKGNSLYLEASGIILNTISLFGINY